MYTREEEKKANQKRGPKIGELSLFLSLRNLSCVGQQQYSRPS
jgi:hypothetical protein